MTRPRAGVIHKNKAARKKSRLAKAMAKAVARADESRIGEVDEIDSCEGRSGQDRAQDRSQEVTAQ